MKIYTKTGDRGETALFGGGRVSKSHHRVEAYGTVDEVNAVLGRALPRIACEEIRGRVGQIQHDLFAVGSILASPPKEGGDRPSHVPPFPAGRVEEMEGWMDAADDELPPLKNFILPGGSEGSAELHLARTVCRRAERRVVALAHEEPDAAEVVTFLNRLSDLLFVFARLENHRAGGEEVVWKKEEQP
jgi:cob(I)alamin adenosyltransferase